MKIKIKGTIVPDDYADVYEWMGISHTAPKDIQLPKNDFEDVEVTINSGGGDVYSGSEIYTKLKAYKGKVTVNIVGIAASMASVIAMAGDTVKMSPTSQMMIHNVASIAAGDKEIMSHEAEVLAGYDKTIANSYRLKTGMSEKDLLKLMNEETWLNPQRAVKLGFADEIMFDDKEIPLLAAGSAEAVFLSKDKVKKFMAEKKKEEEVVKKDKVNQGSREDEPQDKVAEPASIEGEASAQVEAKKEVLEDEQKDEEQKVNEMTDKKDLANLKSDEPQEKVKDQEKEFENFIPKAKGMPKFNDEINEVSLKKVGGTNQMEKTYKDAFFNYIRGNDLDKEGMTLLAEANPGQFSNDFTHDTTNTSIVIPQTTQDKIWARATEGYGFLEDVRRLAVRGELRLVRHKEIAEGDAAWYLESEPTADEKNIFDDLLLKGHELSKAVSISWKLRAMAMEDFENFLIDELGKRISVALGTAVIKGDGQKEATGVITALNADTTKEQLVNVATTGTITYEDILKLIAKVHSSYKANAVIYANSSTIWTKLANVVDKQGRPFFMADRTSEGVGNILGFTVKEDAALTDDQILFGDAMQYILNVNEEMSITTETHAKRRITDYVAYMVADGNIVDTKAFALLSLTQVA